MASVKKRIFHLLDSGGMYGAENVVINLSREMMSSECYEPVVGCIVQSSDDEVDLYDVARQYGIESHKIVINNFFLLLDLPRVARLLKELRVDLVHAHGYKASVFASVVKLLTGIPVMATCHLWFEGPGRPLKMRAMIAVEKFLYRFSPLVVGVSEDIRRDLISAGVATEKLHVVRNGIALSDYVELPTKTWQCLAAELGLQPGDVCVLNVGRLTEQKAQCHIVSAAQQVKKNNENVKFFIVGEGEVREELQQQISSLDLDDTVKLLGFRYDIPDLLQLADLFVLPSLDEGMPMALLEAMASRVPVVATAVGDITKLIIPNVSGIIVEVNDVNGLGEAISNLLVDKKRQHEFADQAFKRLRDQYSSQLMFGQYDEIYREFFIEDLSG